MPMPRPLGITLDKPNGVLIIQWADGALCRYPLSHLREACPCAECRGGHHNMGRQGDPDHILALTPARSYKIVRIELVGNYALQPFWDDNHHTGIYTWEYLRRLCPPPELADSAAQTSAESQ
ncbi:MAG: gamma-butyrobetaine hydroxylase-like domain-containing protein [Aggregatilineales bacterium]